MATGNRLRAVLDVGRLASLLAGPGSDTRNWLAIARVDDDPDAVRWEPGYGWIVDISFTSGELSGEGPFAARVGSPLGGAESGAQAPIPPGSEVLVAIVDGSPNVQCVVLLCLHNPLDQPFPSTVQGESVTEALATENIVGATPKGLRLQLGQAARVSSEVQFSVEAPQVRLGDDTATKSYVLGEDMKAAVDSFAQALIAPGAYTSTSPVVASGTLISAVGNLAGSLSAALSQRIKGE